MLHIQNDRNLIYIQYGRVISVLRQKETVNRREIKRTKHLMGIRLIIEKL